MTATRSLALAVTTMCVLALAVAAQQPSATPAPAPGGALAPPGAEYRDVAFWYQHMNGHNRTAELAKDYLKAEKESEKREIRQKLTDTLNEQFDEHMTQQQKELEDLEKQIADLRAVLKKRSAAKATIVDRRIEQLIQDADGLGWNAPGNPQGSFGSSFRPDSFGRSKSTTGKTQPGVK